MRVELPELGSAWWLHGSWLWPRGLLDLSIVEEAQRDIDVRLWLPISAPLDSLRRGLEEAQRRP